MIVDAVKAFFARHRLTDARVVVACSGGVDSTALLLALSEFHPDLVCAHINHHLRGAESDGDERFVTDLCDRLGLQLEVRDGTLDAEAVRRSGIEAAAREARFARLQEIRGGIGYIATAHQKNDQAETVVMRLATGTGLAGLRGIHPVREDGVIRPLLDVTRQEILAFLSVRDVTPRRDRMNDDTRFLRTRIRAALTEFGADSIDNIAAVATQAQQLWPQLEHSIDRAERQHARITENETAFASWPADLWMRQALLQRHIRRLDPHSRDVSSRDLERLARADSSRVTITKHLELVRRDDAFILRRIPRPTPEFEVRVEASERVRIPEINTTIAISPAPSSPRSPVPTGCFQLPSGSERSFTIRNRRRGDRFRPLGMHHDKKLKDFLIDRKIAAEVRDAIPLVVWNGEIVWVAGVEVSERFKVTGPEGELFEVVLEHESQDQDRVQR